MSASNSRLSVGDSPVFGARWKFPAMHWRDRTVRRFIRPFARSSASHYTAAWLSTNLPQESLPVSKSPRRRARQTCEEQRSSHRRCLIAAPPAWLEARRGREFDAAHDGPPVQ
jgi:hypothetical protein